MYKYTTWLTHISNYNSNLLSQACVYVTSRLLLHIYICIYV